MINSKKLSLITVIIVTLVLILTFAAMLFSDYFKNTDKQIMGTLQYSDVHSVYLDSNDYYTDYATVARTEVELYGTAFSCGGNSVQKDGSFLKIVAGGTYVLKGSWNGTVVVDSQDITAVHLVLAGANIKAEDYCGIYVKQAKKVTVSMAEGSVNNISDNTEYTGKYDEEDVTAAVYSKDDLTFNGTGTLNISANYADGIKCNDGLVIMDGNLNITSADDGINANNYTVILGGNINVNAVADAIKANDTDPEKGFVAIDGGNITINAGDDAVHAESNLYLNGGDVNIESSNEGLEGAYIEINGGNYRVVSSDDGVNGSGTSTETEGMGRGMMANEKSHTEVVILINEGNLQVSAGGDGLDSNGATVVNGGTVQVFGPENSGNASLDFYSTFTVNGGTLIAAGNAGMAETPDEASSQNILTAYLSQTYDAGTRLKVISGDGTEIINVAPDKKYSWVCVSSPDIETGKTYTIYAGEESVAELTVESTINTYRTDESNGQTGFRGGKMRGFENGEKSDFSQMGERPQNMGNKGMRMYEEEKTEQTDNSSDTETEKINYVPIVVSVGILLAVMIMLCFIKRRN